MGAEGHGRGVHDDAAEGALLLPRLLLHQLHAAQRREVAAHVLAPADLFSLEQELCLSMLPTASQAILSVNFLIFVITLNINGMLSLRYRRI